MAQRREDDAIIYEGPSEEFLNLSDEELDKMIEESEAPLLYPFETKMGVQEAGVVTFLCDVCNPDGEGWRNTLLPFFETHRDASIDNRTRWMEHVMKGYMLTLRYAVEAPMRLLTDTNVDYYCKEFDDFFEMINTARTHLASMQMIEHLDSFGGAAARESLGIDEEERILRQTSCIGVQYIAPIALNHAEDSLHLFSGGDWKESFNRIAIASAAAWLCQFHALHVYHSGRCGSRLEGPFVKAMIDEMRQVQDEEVFMSKMTSLYQFERRRLYDHILDAWEQPQL